MSIFYYTKTAAAVENGLFVEATNRSGVISVLAANLKLRDERVTELTITLPAAVGSVIPTYRIVDASHSDAYDSSPTTTLDTVAPPTVSAGTVTLMMQPRSIHLLQFDTTATAGEEMLPAAWATHSFR